MSSPSLDISWQQFVGAFLLMGTALLLGYIGLLLCSYFKPMRLDIQNIESIAHRDIGSLAEFKEALKESSKDYEC